MSDLADLLEPRLEELSQCWTACLVEGLAPGPLPEPTLRDHTAEVLHELVQALRRGSVPKVMARARKHGRQRYEVGFQLGAVVREYGVMRDLILDLSEEVGLSLSRLDSRLLGDFFTVSVTETVDEYERQRDQAEEGLTRDVNEGDAWLRTVLDSTAEGIWGVDQAGRCTFANLAAAWMFGATSVGEMIGHDMFGPPYSHQSPDSHRSFASALTRAFQTRQEVRGEDVWMTRFDGTTFPVRYTISLSLRGDQRLGAVVSFADITERRQNERELATARLMSDSALTAGSVGTFTWDIATDRLHGDVSFSHLFGIRLDASGAAPIADYASALHPDDREATLAKVNRSVQEGGFYEAEYRVVTGGRERWVAARGRVDRDRANRPVRLVGVVMDITERRRLEQERTDLLVREQTARAEAETERVKLHNLFTEVPVGICIFEGPEHLYTFANPAYRALIEGKDVVGKTLFEALPELRGQGVEQPLDQVMASGKTLFNPEQPATLLRDGTMVAGWYNIVFSPKRSATGRVEGVIECAFDVTEQVQARQRTELLADQLRASQENLRRVVDASGVGLWDLDVATGAIEADARMVELMGLPPGSVFFLASGLDELPLEEDRTRVAEAVSAALRGDHGGRYLMEFRTGGQGGVPLRWVESRAQVTFDAKEVAVRLAGAMVDITARKDAEAERERVRSRIAAVEREAEAALRVSEERYRTLFDSIDDGFCLIELKVDAQGQTVDYLFLEANAAFEVQTGLKAPVGKTIRELAPGISTSWFDIYGRVVATGEAKRFENHDPTLSRWFDAYANRVGPAERRQVAIVFKDVSHRKVAEYERENLVKELARSNQELDQFASIASHDLKAPLRGIASLTHWIEDDLGDAVNEEAREKLNLMRGRVQRLEALINGILSYATAGRSQVKPEEVDVGKLLAEVVGLLSPPSHISVTIGDAMPTLVVERVPLQQVFMNLISNAIKHTQQPGAAIRVDSTDEGDSYHFVVADNGPGMDPKDHQRIWGLFQKLESRAQVEGTGIGLSVVKKIIESRGGRVWVESELGRGATFHVLWPKVGRGEAARATPPAGTSP